MSVLGIINSLSPLKSIEFKNKSKKINKELDCRETFGEYSQLYEIKYLLALSNKMRSNIFTPKKYRLKLDRRILSIAARKEIGIQKLDSSGNDLNRLKGELIKYKNNTFSIKNKNLNDDFKILQGLQKDYPAFFTHLIENKDLQKPFFEWTVLNKLDPKLFIKFTTATKLIPAVALRHIGSTCPDALEECIQNGKSTLLLKCKVSEGSYKKVNILDSSTISPFEDDEKRTIHQALMQFPKNSSASRKYQFFKDGLHLYATSEYTNIDFEKEEWWNDLPVYKTVTFEEAKKRYHTQIEKGKWILSPRSVHLSTELSIGGNHSYLEVAIPDADGNYNIYPFGRDPKKDPKGALDALKFVGETTHGRIVYADQGAYYTDRRNTGITIQLSVDKGRALMNEIKIDIENGKKEQIPFQLIGENCAKWVQAKVNYIMGKDAPCLFETKTKKILGPTFGLPSLMQRPLMRSLGVGRKIRIGDQMQSLKESDTYKKNIINHPIKLYQNIKSKSVEEYYTIE